MNTRFPNQSVNAFQSELLGAAHAHWASLNAVDRETVEKITRDRGIEFATAVLFHHFSSQLPGELESGTPIRAAGGFNFEVRPNATLVIVPGALYRERPDVGGDGQMLRDAANKNDWKVELIPTNGVGRVDENAEVIREWIEAKPDEQLILVSLSKGTTDTIAALFDPGKTTPENVVGWVNVSGIPFGTPMVNWMMDRWLFRRIYRFACWIRNASPRAVEDLAFTDERVAALSQIDVPFPIYHLAGFPCREHLSCRRSRLWYRRFQNDGPTDSVLMLSDLFDLPGIVIPVWGADHYLKTGWDACEMFERIIAHLSNQNRESISDSDRPSIAERV